MKSDQVLQRLESIVAQDMHTLEKNAIVRDGNRYWLFGRYEIEGRDGVFSLTKGINFIAEMVNLKSAVSWCIADKYQQHALSRDIIILERHHNLLTWDIEARSTISRRFRNADQREAAQIKISTRRERLRQVENRLDKCVNRAKYLQIQGFQHETARTVRSAPGRTGS